jgi:hypothetical protein
VIPLATTTITVLRPPSADPYGAGYDGTPAAPTTVATGVRAVLGDPRGVERDVGGSQEDLRWTLTADPVDLTHDDQVVDDTTGITYRVVWVARRFGLGLDHIEAELRRVHGEAS